MCRIGCHGDGWWVCFVYRKPVITSFILHTCLVFLIDSFHWLVVEELGGVSVLLTVLRNNIIL